MRQQQQRTLATVLAPRCGTVVNRKEGEEQAGGVLGVMRRFASLVYK